MNFEQFRKLYGKPWFQTAIDRFGLGNSRWNAKIADEILIRLESQTNEHLKFWKEFQSYLANEREQKIDELKDCLWAARSNELALSDCSRIVDSEWSNLPLSSMGSIKRKPGGRFNFGGISSFHADFEALYIADHHDTAFLEKFHRSPGETVENDRTIFHPQDFALMDIGGYVHFKINARLKSVLDLRNPQALAKFAEVISSIDATEYFHSWAKSERISMAMVTDTETLNKFVYEANYTQWAIWLDQPSISQWIGHYARLAGISAIVYHSVRNTESGTNYAIFSDNLEATNSYVELNGIYHGVEEKDRSLNYTAKISEN